MKNMEIKSISAGSVFKFEFILGLVIGLITSIVLLLSGASLKSLGVNMGSMSMTGDGPIQVGATLVGIILGSLAYGFLIALVGVMGALIYNAFAKITGGIVVKVDDRD